MSWACMGCGIESSDIYSSGNGTLICASCVSSKSLSPKWIEFTCYICRSSGYYNALALDSSESTIFGGVRVHNRCLSNAEILIEADKIDKEDHIQDMPKQTNINNRKIKFED